MTFRITSIPTRTLRGVAAWLVMAIATPILLILMLISALAYGFDEAVDRWMENWRDTRPLWRMAWPYMTFRSEQ